MRIAVIGQGNIGGTLAKRWLEAGHDVVFGSRAPDGKGPGNAPLTTIAEAIRDTEVVLLAVPGSAVADVVRANATGLARKVIIDAANRIGQQPVNSRAVIAEAVDTARYVRAFNTLGWENFESPLPEADLFFAADPDALGAAEDLIRAVGLRPVLVGDADASEIVDGLLPLWMALVRRNGGNRRLALAMLT